MTQIVYLFAQSTKSLCEAKVEGDSISCKQFWTFCWRSPELQPLVLEAIISCSSWCGQKQKHSHRMVMFDALEVTAGAAVSLDLYAQNLAASSKRGQSETIPMIALAFLQSISMLCFALRNMTCSNTVN